MKINLPDKNLNSLDSKNLTLINTKEEINETPSNKFYQLNTNKEEEEKKDLVINSYFVEALHKLKITIQIQRPFKNNLSKDSFYNWTTQWPNLHHHYNALIIENRFKKILIVNRLIVNGIYIKSSQNDLKLIINSFGVFNEHNAKKAYAEYIEKLRNRIIKKKLQKLASIYITRYNVKQIQIIFYTQYMPKDKVIIDSFQIFRKNKNERYFKIAIQVIYAVYKGQLSASVLSQFILICVRRNPRRTRFLSFLKRLIDWHFLVLNKASSKISGVRVEIKGRFTAKSRAKKQILSVGRIRIKEKESPVFYQNVTAITKFGSLSIKVWICPKTKQ
jgi:ribosomal protein S3